MKKFKKVLFLNDMGISVERFYGQGVSLAEALVLEYEAAEQQGVKIVATIGLA